MDVKKQENGISEDSNKKGADVEKTNIVKTKTKQKKRRSRSKTPQSKVEETKALHISLQKIETKSADKELVEEIETEKTDKTEELVEVDDELKKDVETEKTDKNEEIDELKKDVFEEVTLTEDDITKEDERCKAQHADLLKAKTNGHDEEEESPTNEETHIKQDVNNRKKKTKMDINEPNEVDLEPVEMDPLFITNEPDPELQFGENSDLESGKGSPVILRCKTRRSQTRNIPTPITPKLLDLDLDSDKCSASKEEQPENDTDEPKMDNTDDVSDSADTTNVSTKAEVGSDITRLDYIERNISDPENLGYLSASRERSLTETLRSLTARRPIRPSNDYRRIILRNNVGRSDLNVPDPIPDSVEPMLTGAKRKRSSTPEEIKKFKSETAGINTLFTSPVVNFRNKFRSDLPSSTPKLLGYRDNQHNLNFEDNFLPSENGDDEKKSWCSIM